MFVILVCRRYIRIPMKMMFVHGRMQDFILREVHEQRDISNYI